MLLSVKRKKTEPGIRPLAFYEHYNEIQNMIKVCVPKLTAHKEDLEKKMEKYKNFEQVIENM